MAMWYHEWGTKCDIIVALVPWLPHAFPRSLFISSLCAHVVFERFTDGEWHNLSRTSGGWGGSLEEVAWMPASQR